MKKNIVIFVFSMYLFILGDEYMRLDNHWCRLVTYSVLGDIMDNEHRKYISFDKTVKSIIAFNAN